MNIPIDRRAAWLPVLALALAVLAVWALTVGSSHIAFGRVVEALWNPGDAREDLVIWTVRMPRVVAAIAIGAALATAGAIMQAVTGNPLAEPGLLGINAGAAFAVVVTIVMFDNVAVYGLVWAAFLGAGLAAVIVYVLGSAGRAGATPVRLILAGVVVSTFLGSITAAILTLDAQTLDAVRLWTAGSLRGRTLSDIVPVLPYVGLALAAAMLTRNQYTALSLGSSVAQSLGQNQAVWRGIAALIVVGLAGGSVAIAGPAGFVGLVVPHLARLSVGVDYRWILPFSAIGGALLTIIADTVPRALLGLDVPIGVTLALVGAPYFIWLVRRRRGQPA